MRVSDIGNIHIRLTFYPSKAIQSTMKICYNHMFSRLNITTMNPSTQSFVIILFILVLAVFLQLNVQICYDISVFLI